MKVRFVIFCCVPTYERMPATYMHDSDAHTAWPRARQGVRRATGTDRDGDLSQHGYSPSSCCALHAVHLALLPKQSSICHVSFRSAMHLEQPLQSPPLFQPVLVVMTEPLQLKLELASSNRPRDALLMHVGRHG